MNRTLLVLIATVALACTAAISHAQRPAKKNSKLSKYDVKNLATLINIIETTRDSARAIRAYARASTIDRNNVALHRAQMRKMLTLGVPLAASYPARALNGLDPKNALAWGVTGYAQGQKRNYDDALRATLKSLALDITNTSVLHSAGELIAWYESQAKPPKLTDRQKRLMDKLKDNMDQLETFLKGYVKIHAAFDKQSRLIKKFDKLIAEAESEADEHRDDLQELADAAGLINDEIDDHYDNIRLLRREYNRYTYIENDDDHTRIRIRSYNWIRRQRILDEIEDEKDEISKLKRERNMLVRKARPIKRKLQKSRSKVNDIYGESRAATERFEASFRWDPPAVDGVMTPKRENIPRSNPKLPQMEIDPKEQANTKLRLARAYIDNDMPDKASEILRKIITKYKDTEAAKEAEKLLKKLPEKFQE